MREVKKALRRELIARRRALDPAEKARADSSIFMQLLPLLSGVSAVFTYVSTQIEVDTRALIGCCLERGVPVAVPVSGDEELCFYYITDTAQLAEGRYGIPEPADRSRPAAADERTLCIVPALCADGEGLRLGYGKGYYDRFLRDFAGRSVILCYESFRREVPAEPHDVRADMTIFDRKNGG